ncbi:MAG: type II secretion system minor pseudopilin GspH [bacterium]
MRTHLPASKGFTLIEILVVVLVVSILMGVVASSFTGSDREQTLRGYSERLALRIEFARDKALQSNREWGVFIDEEGIRFAEFDEVNAIWNPRSDKPFNADPFDRNVEFRLTVEDLPGTLQAPEDPDEDIPQIVLFSSGETTPFEITIVPVEWETRPWLLASDGFTRTSATRSDET